MPAAEQAITVQGVSRSFGTGRHPVSALSEVTFSIAPGQVVALMGDNGAGKSTLLDLICGLTRPTAGTVQVLGREPRQVVLTGDLAAVLQSGGLLPDLTVSETVQLTADLFDRPRSAAEAMDRAGVTAVADRRIALCSGGERQRVKFAMALIPRARVLVLDEPTAGMDWGARLQFWTEMRAVASTGASLLYATHHAGEVVDIADRVLVLGGGRLLADTTVAGLRATSGSRVLRARVADADLDTVGGLPGVRTAESVGDELRLEVEVDHADDAARFLLEHGAGDLRIEDSSLLSALRGLTERGAR